MTFAERILKELTAEHTDTAIDLCREQITTEFLKDKGGNKEVARRAAAIILLNRVDKYTPEWARFTWIDSGYQLLTDGHYVARLTDHIPELPEVPKDFFHPNYKHVWYEAKTVHQLTKEEMQAIQLTAKTHYNKYPAKTIDMHNLPKYEYGGLLFSYGYIATLIQLLGSENISVGTPDNPEQEAKKSILYISSPKGAAVLAPINPPDPDTEDCNTIKDKVTPAGEAVATN